MNKKILKNCRIVDPSQKMDEIGNIIINENGKIEDIGAKAKIPNKSSKMETFDFNNKIAIPGLVDMGVFVGEPGFEYKENFRSLTNAALSGGVTSVVTMPNTKPLIDNVSMVDFIMRRGRDKSKLNIFRCVFNERYVWRRDD